jgi:hypothetical protein
MLNMPFEAARDGVAGAFSIVADDSITRTIPV